MSEPRVALSVVVPMYNEEDVLPLFVQRLRPVLDGIDGSYEVLAVNDGSADATAVILAGMRLEWPELRVITLRRNSGHQAALAAGLLHAHGDYVVSIDADLQDPPEVIPEMLKRARAEGLDVVYGVRSDRRSDTVVKRRTAGAYYLLMRRLVGKEISSHAGDFRLISRTVVETLRDLPERAPVLRLILPWMGFSSGEVTYVREEREAGSTKYSPAKMMRLAMDSITSFSATPLRLATWFGVTGMILCGVLVIIAFVAYLRGATVPGWASLYVAVLFLGAVQLLCLGLLGEYVARIYTLAQGRPVYLVESDSALDPPATAGTSPTVPVQDALMPTGIGTISN